MTTTTKNIDRRLAQTLAIQAQIHLPGTVGRLKKQIRDLERVAPIFAEAGLVRPVERPNPLDLRVSGIATGAKTARALGGALYVAAATRVDLRIDANVIATAGQDSTSEIDDINYENQPRRLQLIGVRQAYRMAEAALRAPEEYDLILMDCPLVLNRSMVPVRNDPGYRGYREAYEETLAAITGFWSKHREAIYPWNPRGPVLVGLAAERYGAIVYVSRQDLRTEEGRRHVLSAERVDAIKARGLAEARDAIVGIGERRFVNGILNGYTRTVAFRMNVQTPEMEPKEVIAHGVLGMHFKSASNTRPMLAQLIGDEPDWTQSGLDRLAGRIMALTVLGGQRAEPLPIQLAAREHQALGPFIDFYCRSVREELKSNEIENLWLSGIEELVEE